jgi:predicted lipoprotein with Yx(FWY)xxD motif
MEQARRRSRVGQLFLVLMGVLVMAGCSRSGTAITQPFTTAAPVLEHGPTYEVKVKSIAGVGPVLVDGRGITLYLFETDQRGKPSRCYDICAVQWPPDVLPVGVTAPRAGPGVVTPLLGTVPRTDGTVQITYHGWPLYYWPPDKAPGKATGQALTNAGGRWYVVDPAGDAVGVR